MSAASERRALLLEADDSYDPFLTIDINEYLIENYPTLTAKNRQSVWHLCQNDEDFDYDSIHNQIDDWVYEYAASDPEVVLEDSSVIDENEDSDEDDDIESLVYVDVEEYLQDNYDELNEEELAYIVELITFKFDYSNVYEQIDQIISNYVDGKYDDELDDASEEQIEVETQSPIE
jgi:hypothetical protein